MGEPGELGDERPHAIVRVLGGVPFRSFEVSLPESGTWSDVINVLLDLTWDMIFFGGNIVSSR